MTTSPEIAEAAKVVRNGDLVAFPTETVFGLGANIFCPQAIEKIFHLKKRPADNPLIAHVSSKEQVEQISHRWPSGFWQLVEHFWPGPLTILAPVSPSVPSIATAGLSNIGIRMPMHPVARELITAAKVPLVAPSANLSGRPSATLPAHVREDFGSHVFVLEGECHIGLESTILQLEPYALILRPGAISAEAIENVLKQPVQVFSHQELEQPLSPGMKYRHYAPKATVELTEHIPAYVATRTKVIYPQAATLYAQLRQADLDEIAHIIMVCDQKVQQDAALMNRLQKIVSNS